jgi:MFS family permease
MIDSPSSGYLALIRSSRNFRLLWFGQIISDLGDWFNLIASASLIGELTNSGLAIGALFFVRALAPFLASPFAGVIADRYNRRNVIILMNIIRTPLMLGFLFVRDSNTVWLLYLLTALQLFVSGIIYPTRTALLPETVSQKDIGTANVITGASFSAMFAIGAALGGFLSGLIGMYAAFLLNALMYLASAIVFAQIHIKSTQNKMKEEKNLSHAIQEYLDGFRYLLAHKYLIVIAAHKVFIGLLLGATFEVVLVSISGSVFVLGEGGGMGLGLIFAATGIGMGLGPIIARKWTRDRLPILAWAILIGYLIGGLGIALTATLDSWAAVLVGNLLRGVGNGMAWLFSTQLVLVLVPGYIRGRVVAVEAALSMLASAIGAALVGIFLDSSLGISGTAWWMAGLTLLPALLWGLWTLTVGRNTPIFSYQGANS